MLEGPSIILRLFTDEDLEEFLKLENTVAEMSEFTPVDLRSHAAFRKHRSETGGWDDGLGRMPMTDKSARIVGHIMFIVGWLCQPQCRLRRNRNSRGLGCHRQEERQVDRSAWNVDLRYAGLYQQPGLCGNEQRWQAPVTQHE